VSLLPRIPRKTKKLLVALVTNGAYKRRQAPRLRKYQRWRRTEHLDGDVITAWLYEHID
jgi:hypothetical protein